MNEYVRTNKYFYFFVTIYFFLRIIKQYMAIKSSENFIDTNLNFYLKVLSKQDKYKKQLIVIIPVFNEADILDKTIQHFKEISNQGVEFKLVFVITEKEGSPENNLTFQKLKYNLNDNMFIKHFPYNEGNKSDQINYVITEYLNNEKYNNLSTYYGIFDADSLPNIRRLDYLLKEHSNHFIYQMFSIYSSNKANAIFQTRWTMSYELPNSVVNYSKKGISHFSYTIGHGLFVRKDYVEENLFPSDVLTEDILFGYIALNNGICVKPIPFFDYCFSSSTLPA